MSRIVSIAARFTARNLRPLLVAAAFALTVVVLLAATLPANARATRVWPAVTAVPAAELHVKRVHISPSSGVLHVRLSNGARWRLTPCKHEDSRDCYWNARKRGNGIGRSFIDLRGTAYTIPARLMRAANARAGR